MASEQLSPKNRWQKLKIAQLFVNQVSNPQCVRCQRAVYPTEKITSSKDGIFHQQCFSCSECGGKLTTASHKTSPSRKDEEIYCVTHVPKLDSAKFGLDAFGIVSAVEATRMRERLQKKRTIRAPNFGSDALGFQHNLRATNLNKYGNYKGGQAHQYPYLLFQARDDMQEEMLKAQEELEQKHRKEEEALLTKVKAERDIIASNAQKEADEEWEQRLMAISGRLAAQFKGKDGDDYHHEKKRLENIGWQDLEAKKTAKIRNRTIKVTHVRQEETAALVEKQSKEMLGLVAQKKLEMAEQIQEEIHAQQTYEHAPSAGMNGRAKIHTATVGEEHTGVFDSNGELMAALQPEEFISSIASQSDPALIAPPVTLKADLYHHCTADEVFQDLDEYVVNIADTEHSTFTELASDLTADLMSDLAKARAIFRWITVKDLNSLEFGREIGDNPLGLLKGIKYGTETYHTLFKRLCSYAGLRCEEIKGKSKSVGYEPGMKFDEGMFQNTWNAVLIDRSWRLIQCNWGARHLVLNKDQASGSGQSNGSVGSAGEATLKMKKDKIRYQYDEHYFLTDPEEFIREFFPVDPKWQLLDNPITLSEFEGLPFVRSVFYHYGMRFKEDYPAVLHTDSVGGAEIRLELPESHCRDIILHYQLRFAPKELRHEVEYKGARLDRFVFQSMLRNEVVYSVHVPTTGEYFLEIFANKMEEGAEDEEGGTNLPFRLKCACKFKIICDELKHKMHALPNCASGEWGPAKSIRHFKLHPVSHPKGVINDDDTSEITFEAERALHFLVKLRMNGVDDHFLDQFVQARAQGDELRIRIRYPVVGQYGLDIYARPQASSVITSPGGVSTGTAVAEGTLAHACKYLINCQRVTKPVELGQARCDIAAKESRERWGPQPLFKKMNLKAYPATPKIKGAGPFEEVVIEAPLALSMSFHFIREPSDDYRDCITMQREASGIARFAIRMSKPGHYMLAIYGRKEGSGSAKGDKSAKEKDKYRIDNLFNYLFVFDPESTLKRRK